MQIHKSIQQQSPSLVHMSSTCDWVFEPVTLIEKVIRLNPDIPSRKEKSLYENVEIQQAFKERAEIYASR